MESTPHPLAAWLEKKGITHVQFGERVGVDNSTISRLISGERGPGLALALAIQRETRGAVPVQFWVKHPARSSSRSA